ncbi:MAG TPA: hypothetical protein VFO40_29320 [Chthoniobacterales bacterium]|nr:hypothetical protein [Chthoniobacterales bacterium]
MKSNPSIPIALLIEIEGIEDERFVPGVENTAEPSFVSSPTVDIEYVRDE